MNDCRNLLKRPDAASSLIWESTGLWAWSVSLFGRRARFFAPARSAQTPTRAVDVKAGRRSDLAKYTDIARPCLDIHEHGGRLDAVGRQRAISGIGLAINSVRRPIGSSVFGLTLESRLNGVSKTFLFETA